MNGTLQRLNMCTNRRRRGFTAVEIAMVATVIAILALLILPIYRTRVEEARKTAVQDELASLAKIQLLIEADVNMHARLQDLDNSPDPNIGVTVGPEYAVPIAAWNGTFLSTTSLPGDPTVVPKSRVTIIPDATRDTGWKGPYMAFKNYRTVEELQLYWFGGVIGGGNGGFVYVVGNGTGTATFDGNEDRIQLDRYPVDPWGQPYIFYGRGYFPNGDNLETDFNWSSAVVYSMGPDGLPGSGALNPLQDLYRREQGVLGTGDDYEYRF